MSALEKPGKSLTVDADVIVKLAELRHFNMNDRAVFNANQGIYISTKEFVDNITYCIIKSFSPDKLFKEGIELAILEPGPPWVTGKIRFNIGYDFIPDKPEITETVPKDLFESSLDDIRKTMK